MKSLKVFFVSLFICLFASNGWGAWEPTKPADNEKLKDTPAILRANWSAIETGTDPALLITNAKVSASAGIVDTKLATISTAGKVSGTAITGLSSVPAGAGALPIANGGTGQTSRQASLDALLDTQTGQSGKVLKTDGANASWGYPSDLTISSQAQGDLLYYGTAWTRLAKDTNATRYLSNTGTSNNPAWAQVNLANGVTGTLPVANGGTGATSFTAYGVLTGGTTSTGAVQSISAGTSGQLLTSNGASALPSFQNAPSSGGWEFVSSGTMTIAVNSNQDITFTPSEGYLYKIIYTGTLSTTGSAEDYADLSFRISGNNADFEHDSYKCYDGTPDVSVSSTMDRWHAGTFDGYRGFLSWEISLIYYQYSTGYYAHYFTVDMRGIYKGTSNSTYSTCHIRGGNEWSYGSTITSIGMRVAQGSGNYGQNFSGYYTIMRQKR